MYLEYIKSALSSIRNNKGRSFLTMLGIIIGISSVLTVLIIGDGMKETVNGEMDSIGATTVSVSLDATKTEKTFSKQQFDEIEAGISGIYGISPGIQYWGYFITPRKTFDAMISGESQVQELAGTVTMVHGRYITKTDVDDSKKVIVVSQAAAKAMFGYEEVVGRTIEIDSYNGTNELLIIGVRKDNAMDTAYASYLDEPTLMGTIPYTTLCDVYQIDPNSVSSSFSIYLDSENKDQVLAKTRSVVENVMGLRGENAVKVSSGYGFDATTDSIMTIITSVIAIIAAISLLVGGIGVMNIMTVSVTERTREIGIRKSLGARTNSILTQFLAEAAILTFLGGVIGILFGVSISYLICKVVGFSFIVNPMLVLAVVMVSTAIGLFFGIYPAKRAARLDPIEALRTE
ncbi:ABC transporter permease [Butyrivibrio sp. YAB3001]|uniref:ABC transporter permease n=1 Tax=Butyrivibrio sp. YAB3001 TaxID=1520812 RepID=UPI0008F623D7|nr:ABC transporter permease [Butyrivibrio sp. YAB3001]SFC60287.1 putative ABC transport system permease protein [Butyrivibrio sp. YAB3001]